ncbi:MAG: UDP-glucose 4-epimerase GalE [Spirochaetaceae bacterium]|nr:MAG: UDP-glucose 4-epimerase GalE [Spirochaetaceae bacterium]
MRIVVIGGAGYIGSHVARHLLDSGHEVVVYDNLSHGLHANLFADAQFIHGDIHDPLAIRAALSAPSRADAVVHLAAAKAAGESMVNPQKYSTNNIVGTIAVLNAMADVGVRRIVFSSSAAVYGEPEYLPIDEAHPTNPINYYGFTKLEIERILGWYDRLKGIRFAALRYFNAAGYDAAGRVRGLELDPANLLPIVMEVAIGIRSELRVFGDDYPTPDGTCIRDYIHVSDLATGHLAALDWIDANDRSITVNLGTGVGISVTEMLEAAREITGKPIPARVDERRPGDPAELVASASHANEVLGWTATQSSRESLVRTSWDAYLASRDR